MGARHSQHRYSHPTNTTFEQDAAIGGAGGAVLGLASGLGYFFVNQVGLRASITLMGFAVVSGTIVGAIVCVAGAVAIKSLAWLYRQLRKRTRHGMDIHFSVMTAAAAAEEWGGGGGGRGGGVRSSNFSSNTTINTTTTTGSVLPTTVPTTTTVTTTTTTLTEEALAMQQAALDEARVERARALEDLRRYDELLAQAEQRLRLAAGGAAVDTGVAPAGGGEEQEGQVQVEGPQPRVMPPPDNFFQSQPVHITLRLRDTTEGDSDSNTEEDRDAEFYLVEDEDEEQGGGLRAAVAAGGEGSRRGTTTPPIY